MIKNKGKNELKDALALIQTILATSVFVLAIGYMFEHQAYLVLLQSLLILLLVTITYNNHKYYKVKAVTPICVILLILMGVFFVG